MDDNPDTAADTSVLAVLSSFAEDGWVANHTSEPDGAVRCGRCDEVNPGGAWEVGARHRVEGASDPADMQVVYGMRCPACGADGALLVGYGATASDQDQDLLTALPEEDDDLADPVAASSGSGSD
ncbi:MAG: hypothetical protein HKN44_04140 [Ilumatobacter sp.]|nr:hypothetical protein [Ilumatobacter sp.]